MKLKKSAKRAGKRGVKDLPVSAKAKDTKGGAGMRRSPKRSVRLRTSRRRR
jgi:hypothetical protein